MSDEVRWSCEHPAAEHSALYGCTVIPPGGSWCPCYSATGVDCG